MQQPKAKWQHPEQHPNEIFLINIREAEKWREPRPSFILKVRVGNVAYRTGSTEVIPNMKPLFGILKPECL